MHSSETPARRIHESVEAMGRSRPYIPFATTPGGAVAPVAYPHAATVRLPLTRHRMEAKMRTNIVLDDELVEEGFALTGLGTKRELVHMALDELVRRRRKKDPFGLAGKVQFRPDFDHKSLRQLRDGSG